MERSDLRRLEDNGIEIKHVHSLGTLWWLRVRLKIAQAFLALQLLYDI